MNALFRNLTQQAVRNHKLLIVQCNRFATDSKVIEEMTKKNKVVVFMKVSLNNVKFQNKPIKFPHL
jgi:hypothetical protein